MSRAHWKGPFIESSLLRKKIHHKTWARASTIPFFLIGQTVAIHNGRDFKRVAITRDKVGFKFGDFSSTRKFTKKQKKVRKK